MNKTQILNYTANTWLVLFLSPLIFTQDGKFSKSNKEQSWVGSGELLSGKEQTCFTSQHTDRDTEGLLPP